MYTEIYNWETKMEAENEVAKQVIRWYSSFPVLGFVEYVKLNEFI